MLDTSQNQSEYQKTFTDAENIYDSSLGELPIDTVLTLYSKVFTTKFSVSNPKGVFYLYTNIK